MCRQIARLNIRASFPLANLTGIVLTRRNVRDARVSNICQYSPLARFLLYTFVQWASDVSPLAGRRAVASAY